MQHRWYALRLIIKKFDRFGHPKLTGCRFNTSIWNTNSPIATLTITTNYRPAGGLTSICKNKVKYTTIAGTGLPVDYNYYVKLTVQFTTFAEIQVICLPTGGIPHPALQEKLILQQSQKQHDQGLPVDYPVFKHLHTSILYSTALNFRPTSNYNAKAKIY